jgi:protein TonB
MVGTLIESRAVPQRRTGSSFASVAIHAAVIVAGVIATARQMVVAPLAPPQRIPLAFVRPVDAVPVTTHSAQGSVSSIAAPVLRRFTVPSIVPIGIPPVDLGAATTAQDWGHGPIMDSRITCDRDCGSGPVTDAGGRAIWSTSDVLMRLLEDPVPPRYPESLRRAGVEGDVVVRFLVDTLGRVDMRTVEVMRSTHEAFTAAVRETLSKLRFSPAMAGERKSNALAVMPFRFTLR